MAENQNPVFTDDSLTGDGTVENPLAAVGGGGGTIESTDNSIEVTTPVAGTTDLSVNGPDTDITLGDNCQMIVSDEQFSPPKLRKMTGWTWSSNGSGGMTLVAVPFNGNGPLMLLENQSGNYIFQFGSGAGGGDGAGTWTLRQNGDLRMAGTHINFSDGAGTVTLQVFADNAAALAGGLVVGDLYRTGADPDLVAIVH